MTILKTLPALAMLAGALLLDAHAQDAPPAKPKALVVAQLMDEEAGTTDRTLYIRYIRNRANCVTTKENCDATVDLMATLATRGFCIDGTKVWRCTDKDFQACWNSTTFESIRMTCPRPVSGPTSE